MDLAETPLHTPLTPPIVLPMVVAPPHPCAYLPQRVATMRAFYTQRMSGQLYHQFMDRGFRRSGQVIYQPFCDGCRACVPVRVPVQHFSLSRSERRCRKRNADLSLNIDRPRMSDEKLDLYRRYLSARHHGSSDDDHDSLEQFLYRSPVDTIEFVYRYGDGRLAAVGICDQCLQSLSSVYFYFDPTEPRRGLGIFLGALTEIHYAQIHAMPYYYLGYWVIGCKSMQYKTSFRPYELLQPDGQWRS